MPEMAGAFAKRIGAKKLVLNHIGGRYDYCFESLMPMILPDFLPQALGIVTQYEPMSFVKLNGKPVLHGKWARLALPGTTCLLDSQLQTPM